MRTNLLTYTAAGLIAMTTAVYAQSPSVTHSVSTNGATTVTTTASDGSTHSTTRYYINDQDLNHNGILDSEEFAPYVFNRWDLNQDGYISNDEWLKVSKRWYASPTQTEYNSYNFWDLNHDGRITQDEVQQRIAATKLYNSWDLNGDNVIDANEYDEGTFRMHDLNGDGKITMDEWKDSR